VKVPETEFEVATARPKVTSVPFSHLSVELGHLYMEDLVRGPEALAEHFTRIRPVFEQLRERVATRWGARPRISTCFLVDDYFSRLRSPAELIPELLSAAAEAGVAIDYLARESGCAHTGKLSPAEIVLGRLVSDPAPGTDGARPPTLETGWLSNGEREQHGGVNEAMTGLRSWRPPRENSARMHSVYMDVELWHEHTGERVWSCAYLAAVWQLLRLGVLRDQGRPLIQPELWEDRGSYPGGWSELPPVIRLEPRAQPFCAFRTHTILDTRFLPTEAAVRVILDQVSLDPAVRELTERRAREAGIELPPELVTRISHVFSDDL
jgi:hypothetical protein